MEWLWRSSQMTTIFGVDDEIDTSSGSQIDETSTSPAESPSVTDNDTWSDGVSKSRLTWPFVPSQH